MSKQGVYGVNSALFSAQPAVIPPRFSGINIPQLDPGTTRVIGHIILTIVMWLASTLGESAMVNFARRSLKRGNAVPVTHLLGWNSLGQSFSWVFKTRGLPGGFFWFTPMILTVLSGTLANLLLAALTTGVAVDSTCGGQIQLAIANASIGVLDSQGPGEPIFADALQAQVYSLANGGLQGVYHAAPVDPFFKAFEADVAGGWLCTLSWTQTWAQTTNDEALDQFLSFAGGNASNSNCGTIQGVDDNCWGVGLDWSDPTNLKVFIAIELPLANNSFPLNNVGDPNTVDGYLCTLNVPPALSYVSTRVAQSYFTNSLGSAISVRVVYDRTVMHQVIELVSNALLATNSYAIAGSSIFIEGAQYGCVKTGTRIELPACILIAVCVLATVGWGALAGIAKLSALGSAGICPVGLRGWIDQAIREVGAPDITPDTEITAARRRDWAMMTQSTSTGQAVRIGLVDKRNTQPGFVAGVSDVPASPWTNNGYQASSNVRPSMADRTPSAMPLLGDNRGSYVG